MSIFEQASKEKLRFVTGKGVVSSEDLWDLSLESLNALAKEANKAVKSFGEEDFIKASTKKTKSEIQAELRFGIILRVIEVKLEEKERKALAAEKAAKRAQLLELIGKKELTALEGQSVEELKKQLAELD
jgi:hypothetical protein